MFHLVIMLEFSLIQWHHVGKIKKLKFGEKKAKNGLEKKFKLEFPRGELDSVKLEICLQLVVVITKFKF